MLDAFAMGRVLLVSVATFIFSMAFTPLVTKMLYRYHIGKTIRDAAEAPIVHALHAKKAGTPTMGGLVVWVPVLVLTLGVAFLSGVDVFPNALWDRLNFFTRSQTWLPLGVLVASALVGLVDDFLNARGIGRHGGGLRARHRLLIFGLIALAGAWWFYAKLDWDVLHVPFVGDWVLGPWYIPVFTFILIATAFSVNQTDGLDGLAGGVLLTSFGAYGAIALLHGRPFLATLCAAVVGGLLAFLWFNIHPARFFMGDTGSMSLGITLGVIAMLTNQPLLLPVIGIVFVIESLSSIMQILLKAICKKKFFLSSPLHHHLEAKGWPEPKIVMRAWVVSIVAAGAGVALAVLDWLMRL